MGELQEVRCPVGDLVRGMHVSRLDRPWIETPFMLAGFTITSDEEIELLKKYCKHVYLDVEIGIAPEKKRWGPASDELPLITVEEERSPPSFNPGTGGQSRTASRFEQYRQATYATTTTFSEELATARIVHKQLHDQTERLLSDLQAGHKLDFDALRDNVYDTVESIIRNPSALMLLVQLEKSDRYTYSHALGTSVWCAEFGRHLGLDKAEIRELALGGLLLDVGKTRLPQDVFSKTDFDEKDRHLIQTHVACSLEILAETSDIEPSILTMVATHHERFNGTGYPKQLEGDQIPITGQIAGLVDSYDAMTTKRPYTERVYSPHEAVSQIYTWRDHLFDAELVEQFIQTIGIYPAGSLVELDNGEVGVVVSINNQRKLSPAVLLVLNHEKKPCPAPAYLDLSKTREPRRVLKGLPPGSYGVKFEEINLEGTRMF